MMRPLVRVAGLPRPAGAAVPTVACPERRGRRRSTPRAEGVGHSLSSSGRSWDRTMFTVIGPILWSACFLVAVVAAVLAGRSRRAMVVGRIAVGVLMLVGGAAFNAVQLLLGN